MSDIRNKPRILISAAASPAAASLVQHLRSKGYYIIGMDANEYAAPLGAAMCDDFVLSPMATDSGYLPFLATQLDRCDLFLPFIDEELLAIVNASAGRIQKSKIMLSADQSMNICLDKLNFQTFCENNDLAIAPRAIGVPAIYKPRNGRGGKGVMLVDDEAVFALLSVKEQGILQQQLKGVEYTVDCLFGKDSALLSAVARQRLLAAGVSNIGRIDQNPQVLELVTAVSKKLNFRGLVNIQMMLTDAGPKLIEINPRLSGSLMFTILAGADLADAAIRLWLNDEQPPAFTLSEKTFCRYWSEYVY
jgi:carbamoyl-phosphate synthase large subunit